MSRSEAHEDVAGFRALEEAVEEALARIRELEASLRETRARKEEVEGLLDRMTSGEENPARMAESLEVLGADNHDLRSRLKVGREVTERLLARVRYLEEHG